MTYIRNRQKEFFEEIRNASVSDAAFRRGRKAATAISVAGSFLILALVGTQICLSVTIFLDNWFLLAAWCLLSLGIVVLIIFYSRTGRPHISSLLLFSEILLAMIGAQVFSNNQERSFQVFLYLMLIAMLLALVFIPTVAEYRRIGISIYHKHYPENMPEEHDD